MIHLKLRKLLIEHEGMKLKPYLCTSGRLTIGVGRNLTDTGISEMEAELMLANDVERVEDLAEANFPWFKSLDWTRKDVIISMIFNLGFQGFLGFRKMTIAISEGKFEQAATEMLDSKWAIQVGRRAYELSEMMRLGEYLK